MEDQVSAIKIAPYHDSLALLGTGISEAKAAEIAAGGYKHVCLCLDNDATYQAIKLQIEWRSRIPNLCVKGLEKDVKNMNREEFEEFLKWF